MNRIEILKSATAISQKNGYSTTVMCDLQMHDDWEDFGSFFTRDSFAKGQEYSQEIYIREIGRAHV